MKLCQEVVYHLNKLAQLKRTGERGSEEEQSDDGGGGESDCCSHCGGVMERWTVHVALKDVLREPRVQKLCTSLEEIRCVYFQYFNQGSIRLCMYRCTSKYINQCCVKA